MLEIPDFRLTNKRSADITDMGLAMSTEPINDYLNIPTWRYTDWQLLLKMNDNPGPFHNMLSFEQRQRILLHIQNFKKAHY